MDNNNNRNDETWNPSDYEIYTLKEDNIPESEIKKAVNSEAKKPAPKKKKKKKKSILPYIIIAAGAALIIAGLFAFKYFRSKDIDPLDKAKEFFNNTDEAPAPAPATVKITFPEGYTIYQYAELLEQNSVCSKEKFYEAVNTPVDGIEITNSGDRVFLLEGYLFPDTYDFYKNEDANSVVKRFIDNYNSKITDEMKAQAQSLGYTMDEMLTLASVIQKECDFDIEECRNVSSVFHNRLSASRENYLGSDVTYFYLKNMADYLGGSESAEFDGYLTKYYTYSGYRKGLPAGPVCNPGLKAVEAALTPNDTKYNYFLTDESGENFYYAETFEQHQKNGKLAGLKGF